MRRGLVDTQACLPKPSVPSPPPRGLSLRAGVQDRHLPAQGPPLRAPLCRGCFHHRKQGAGLLELMAFSSRGRNPSYVERDLSWANRILSRIRDSARTLLSSPVSAS